MCKHISAKPVWLERNDGTHSQNTTKNRTHNISACFIVYVVGYNSVFVEDPHTKMTDIDSKQNSISCITNLSCYSEVIAKLCTQSDQSKYFSSFHGNRQYKMGAKNLKSPGNETNKFTKLRTIELCSQSLGLNQLQV